MTDADLFAQYLRCHHVGRGKCITAMQLKVKVRYDDTMIFLRDAKRPNTVVCDLVGELRDRRPPVIICSFGNGYCWPSCKADIDESVEYLDGKIWPLLRRRGAMRKARRQWVEPAQGNFFDL